MKSSWASVEQTFKTEFCNINNNPSLVAEEATFNTLALKSGQPIEEFASVQEKGRRLEKSDRDMSAGRVSTLRDALHSVIQRNKERHTGIVRIRIPTFQYSRVRH